MKKLKSPESERCFSKTYFAKWCELSQQLIINEKSCRSLFLSAVDYYINWQGWQGLATTQDSLAIMDCKCFYSSVQLCGCRI